MGGEHKCPVCQSTFTRPQHVARHMRSHTGDRPYKCQFCGDQFARSDLLARHVNKCHAHEKPLLPPPGPRRKGSASTSRATTSKQACDQCVQHSLPCDGANPCGKCSQRKLRCTFIKFHRQTAPLGPGHDHPQADLSTSSASRSDFLPPLAVPSMGENIFSDSFMFPPIYSDNALAQPVSTGEPSDFTSRYRARSDLLKRTNEQVGTSPALPHSWASAAAPSTWDQSRFNQEQIHRHQQLRQYLPNDISIPFRHSIPRPKYEFEVDLDFSDGSTSSIPSSTASEIHLPLPAASAQETGAFNSSGATFSHSAIIDPTASPFSPQVAFHPSSSFHDTANIIHPTSAALSKNRKDIDESAFGALSIDDSTLLVPNAPSFFSDVDNSTQRTVLTDPNDTPMPPRPTSTTEGDADLWRAFMRSTPIGEQPHNQLPSRRASVPTFSIGHTASEYHPSAHAQDKRSSSSQIPFHEPRYALQTQQSDDLLRYRQAVLARARETETVLRPPPSKPRPSVVDTEHDRAALTSARRRVSRPGSSESSGSSRTSASSLVGPARGAREERLEMVKPRMKRELSSATRGEPESKRRVVGGDGGEGRRG